MRSLSFIVILAALAASACTKAELIRDPSSASPATTQAPPITSSGNSVKFSAGGGTSYGGGMRLEATVGDGPGPALQTGAGMRKLSGLRGQVHKP